jgi:hypothetical protein
MGYEKREMVLSRFFVSNGWWGVIGVKHITKNDHENMSSHDV